ncbi:hypothetical protein STENM327S_06613 [Streptomyces tendae]
MDELLGQDQVNRTLAGRVSALDTAYRPADPDAGFLVGRRMPDIALTAAGSPATRVYDLLHTARFVHLDLAPGPTATAGPDRDARVTSALVTGYDDHPDLRGTTEVLVRPDGHIAWTTRTTDPAARRTEWLAALTRTLGDRQPAGTRPTR